MKNKITTTVGNRISWTVSTPVLLLVSIALLVLALFVRQDWKQTVSVAQVAFSDPFHTPAVLIRDTGLPSKGTVILVHGAHCNKSMMVGLGKYLATRGLTVYAIDLPGHGESQLPFTEGASLGATAAVVNKVFQLSASELQSIVLIGHSYGSTVLAPVALARRDVAASIFLGPGKIDNLRQNTLRNVLVITGERDYDYIKKYAFNAFRDLSGQPHPTPSHTTGYTQSDTGPTWFEIPAATHLGLLYNRGVYEAVGEWIETALHTRLNPGRFAPFPWLLFVLPLAIAGVVAVLLSRILIAARGDPVPLFSSVLQPLLVCAYALIVGTILGLLSIQLRSIHLLEGEILISFLGPIGIVGLLVILALRRTWRVPSIGELSKGLLAAVLTFVALYWGLTVFVGPELYHLNFPLWHTGRMRAFGEGFIGMLPFFITGESVRCHFFKAERTSGVFISNIACVLFYATPIGILIMAGSGLSRFTIPFLFVIVYCIIIGSIFYRATRSVIPGAIFTSLVASWLISVGFAYY